MDTNDNETTEPVFEFKFHKENILPAIKRNSKKIIAGAAVFAATAALTVVAFRSVEVDDSPEELEHDDLDEIDAIESSDSDE